jgi:hypothetical protein
MALQPFVGPWPFFSFLILYTAGGTVWTGDQPIARPLRTHRTTHKHRINDTDIHALGGIRTYDPSVRASEDNSCLRPRGHCDRQINYVEKQKVAHSFNKRKKISNSTFKIKFCIHHNRMEKVVGLLRNVRYKISHCVSCSLLSLLAVCL